MSGFSDFLTLRNELERIDGARDHLTTGETSPEEEKQMARDDTPQWREFIR